MGFLSYARVEAAEATVLQDELRLRGIRVWRDVTDLPAGGYTRAEVERAIAREASLILLYLTGSALERAFIWEVEVPAALTRWKADPLFRLTPIFRSVTPVRLREHCERLGIERLDQFNGSFVPQRGSDDDPESVRQGLQATARDVLASAFPLHLRRIQADESYVPRLCFRSFEHAPPGHHLDLDMNWAPLFRETSPDPEIWQRRLAPALRDVKDILSGHIRSRALQIAVQARLPAALALGAAFPASAHFTLLVEARDAIWSSSAHRLSSAPLKRTVSAASGNPDVAVFEVAISRESRTIAIRTIEAQNLSHRYYIRMEPLAGPSRESVRDPVEAASMAVQVGDELRRLRDELGIRHVHLFAAMPAALAVLTGHQINATSTITVYHTDGDTQHIPAYSLGGTVGGRNDEGPRAL